MIVMFKKKMELVFTCASLILPILFKFAAQKWTLYKGHLPEQSNMNRETHVTLAEIEKEKIYPPI